MAEDLINTLRTPSRDAARRGEWGRNKNEVSGLKSSVGATIRCAGWYTSTSNNCLCIYFLPFVSRLRNRIKKPGPFQTRRGDLSKDPQLSLLSPLPALPMEKKKKKTKEKKGPEETNLNTTFPRKRPISAALLTFRRNCHRDVPSLILSPPSRQILDFEKRRTRLGNSWTAVDTFDELLAYFLVPRHHFSRFHCV